jgi:uncharacterized protein (UPF0332 family)
VQPEEAIQLAERLLDDPNAPESDRRIVAHIAYYSVFHVICKYFDINSTTNYGESKHKLVRERLGALDPVKSPPEIKEAKRVVERLWKLRVHADYQWDKIFTIDDAEDALEWAKGVFGRVEQGVSPKSDAHVAGLPSGVKPLT